MRRRAVIFCGIFAAGFADYPVLPCRGGSPSPPVIERKAMNKLEESNANIQQASRALERAHATNDLNERLRCLHNARQLITEAWNQIVEWRKGDAS